MTFKLHQCFQLLIVRIECRTLLLNIVLANFMPRLLTNTNLADILKLYFVKTKQNFKIKIRYKASVATRHSHYLPTLMCFCRFEGELLSDKISTLPGLKSKQSNLTAFFPLF